MKIVVFEAEFREAPAFEPLEADHELVLVGAPLEAENAGDYADAEIVSTFIYSKLDRDVLAQLAALRMIATRSTGFDHIDVAYCGSRGVVVSNVPSYGEKTVAEHVFALLLAISHRIPEAFERAQHGSFSPHGLQGFDLSGKTLGVMGTGSIGRHVIEIAHGFGMQVVAFDVHPDEEAARKLGFRYVEFKELLGAADVISLHVPATPKTHHLLSGKAFATMRDGVVIINTARGDLIDSGALIQALISGKVAAAGLDVLPDEPIIREEAELISSTFVDKQQLQNLAANHVLLRMRNVIVTPHSAFNTREAVARIVETTVQNIAAFVAGAPQNMVGQTRPARPAAKSAAARPRPARGGR